MGRKIKRNAPKKIRNVPIKIKFPQNATMAAIKAGYSPESAHQIGHENLRKPEIAKEIRRLKGAIKAGYSPRTAHVQGPRMLENVRVRAHIEKALAERSRRTGREK